MSLFYKYHPLKYTNANIRKIILLNNSVIKSKLNTIGKNMIIGNRLSIFPNYPDGDVTVILTNGLNRISVGSYYIRIDAGVSYFKIYQQLFKRGLFIPLNYPHNPFETIGGLYIQGLIMPEYQLSYEDIIYKILYYDLRRKRLIDIRKNFDKIIRRKDTLLIRFYFKKYSLMKKSYPSILVGNRCKHFSDSLIRYLPQYMNLEIFREEEYISIILQVISDKHLSIAKDFLRKAGCEIEYIHRGNGNILNNLVFINLSPKYMGKYNKICMHEGFFIGENTVYSNLVPAYSISFGEDKHSSKCILMTTFNKGSVKSVWR